MQNHFKLRTTQAAGVSTLMSTLRTVEITPVDKCNRTCNFCPRSSEYYINKHSQLELSIVKKIAQDLEDIKFDGRVSFAGFGEPLLYKNLCEAISIIKHTVTNITWIEVVTSGDFLNSNFVKNLENAGCTNITVSMYDYDKSNSIIPLFDNSSIYLNLKHCYQGFNKVNRKDILQKKELNLLKECYIPFYKMLIDVDGKVLLCSHDWSRTTDFGDVKLKSIKDIWLGDKLTAYRRELRNKTRNIEPCKFCDVNGTLIGKESFDILSCSIL